MHVYIIHVCWLLYGDDCCLIFHFLCVGVCFAFADGKAAKLSSIVMSYGGQGFQNWNDETITRLAKEGAIENLLKTVLTFQGMPDGPWIHGDLHVGNIVGNMGVFKAVDVERTFSLNECCKNESWRRRLQLLDVLTLLKGFFTTTTNTTLLLPLKERIIGVFKDVVGKQYESFLVVKGVASQKDLHNLSLKCEKLFKEMDFNEMIKMKKMFESVLITGSYFLMKDGNYLTFAGISKLFRERKYK